MPTPFIGPIKPTSPAPSYGLSGFGGRFNDGSGFDDQGNNVAAPTAPVVPTPIVPTPDPFPRSAPATTTDQYSDIEKSSQAALLRTATPVQTEDQIRQDKLKNSQGIIDAINLQFGNALAVESGNAQRRDTDVRQSMLAQGLAGSTEAPQAAAKVTAGNDQIRASIEAQKSLQIQGIFQQVNKDAETELRRQEAEFKAQAEGNLVMVDKLRKAKVAQTNASKENFLGMAKMGISLDQLKALDPKQYDTVIKNSGFDSPDLASLAYNANMAKKDQIDYQYKFEGGKAFAFGVDPKTGQPVLKQVDLGIDVPIGAKVEFGPDGTMVIIPSKFDPNIPLEQQIKFGGKFKKADELNITSTYKVGENPVTDGWVNRLNSGQSKMSDVPKEYKNAVVVGLNATTGGKLSAIQSNIKEAKLLVDILIDHPGRKSATGVPNLFTNPLGFSLPSSNARDFQAQVERLNALLFLNAVPQMRGLGQLTEREGAKLEASSSITKNFGIKEETYLEDLKRLQTNLSSAYENIGGGINIPSTGNTIEYNGKQYQVDEQGNFDPNSPLTSVGSGTNNAQGGQAMRTDRHNNPSAFTTDIAKMAGLQEGVDYTKGDPFSNGRYSTARLLNDPIATTIKVIDKIGFKTASGGNRWTYTDSIPETKNWSRLSYNQKKDVIAKMYQHEGGSQLNRYFA